MYNLNYRPKSQEPIYELMLKTEQDRNGNKVVLRLVQGMEKQFKTIRNYSLRLAQGWKGKKK